MPSPPRPPDDHAFGAGYYTSLWGCIARAIYEQEHDDPDITSDAHFGTLMHEWLAAYHSPDDPLPALSSDPWTKSCSLSELAARYAEKYPRDIFGKTRLVEERLRGMNVEGTDAEGVRWSEPYAGTLDRVGELDESHVAKFYEVTGIILPGPGLYQIDHKTKKAKPNYRQMTESPQFTGNVKLWEHHHPEEPLKGTLVNILLRYIKPHPDQFKVFFAPPPDEAAVSRWKFVVRGGAERRRRFGDEALDPTRCFDYHRECPRLAAGRCGRGA